LTFAASLKKVVANVVMTVQAQPLRAYPVITTQPLPLRRAGNSRQKSLFGLAALVSLVTLLPLGFIPGSRSRLAGRRRQS
jgi:hypothetical protein